jgi:DUF971 family protein
MTAFRQLRPVRVEETRPDEVTIEWADGRVTRHGYRALRLQCQCAGCRDEWTGERRLRPEDVPADIHPEAIQPVGTYALRFVWSDGHDTGMYPFAFLYEQGEEVGGG